MKNKTTRHDMKKPNNIQRTILRTLLLLAALAPVGVWGQETDYSGVYYIASRDYVEANTTTNYYLCPTEEWAYYQSSSPYYYVYTSGCNTDNPFMTTYQCRNGVYDSRNAVWIIEKAPAPNDAYYHIRRAIDGKYLTYNVAMGNSSNVGRMRIHLEATADGDNALFQITYIQSTNSYDITTKNYDSGTTRKYLNITGASGGGNGNQSSLKATNARADGPNGFKNVGGILGLWTSGSSGDNNSKWYLEEAVKQPVISQAANGDITITCATGSTTTIYYTLDGSDPVVPADGTTDPTDPNTYKYSTSFSPAIGSTGVKAVAVLSNMHAAVSKKAELSFSAYTTPTISFDGLDQVTISAAHTDATIYYTTDNTAPVVGTSPTYSTPLTISSTTIVRAVATHTGFLTSAEANSGELEPGTVDAPTVNYSCDNSVSLEVAVGDIYYNIGNGTQADPDNSSTLYENPFTPSVGQVIKAITYIAGYYSTVTSETYNPTHTAVPTIESDEGTVTVTGPAGSTIYFTTDGTDPTTSLTGYSSPHVFTVASPVTVKAIAKAGGLLPSCVVSRKVSTSHSIRNATDLANIANDLAVDYIILNDIDVSGFTTIAGSFTGTIEADINPTTKMPYRITNLSAPLFTTLTGTAKNLVIESVSISNHSGNTGAIACTANDAARIYNVGILSGAVGGTGNVGGLVGFLDGTARVVNCYSYADITGGTNVGGIVGYNNQSTSAANNNQKTMVFACMFYGDITGGTTKSPIYGGTIISNAGSSGTSGVSNFNYFRLEAPYVNPTGITYNCALGAEDRFLKRFEFYRHLLNGHRELAGWWATGTYSKDDILKWVLLPDSLGTDHPYPILMQQGKYPSVVNLDAANAQVGKPRNQGGKLGELAVHIQMGSGGAVYGAPAGAAITTSDTTLIITDKDPDHFNFNYYKVQLPYYNEVGTKNYNGNRVVTGWKIVSITGGTAGTFSTNTADAPSWNFADRNCTNKDHYSVSGRIFNQGAYWDVPEGVTAITIEPYWARCVYLADQNADKIYKSDMSAGYDVSNVGGGQIYTNGNSYPIAGDNQLVYTTMGDAIASSGSALFVGVDANNQSVYDYAVVLVGNYHHYYTTNASIEASKAKPYTVTSIDLDGDNEPDYSYIMRFDGRTECHPLRVDFINIPGLGMAQKSTGGTGSYNFGILIPKGWYESTNTSLLRFTQFEYENQARSETDALIVQGGVMEQWVSYNQKGRSNKIPYIHVGGNVWFKEFHTGCHQDKNQTSGNNRFQPTKHSPISVTGGDFDEFYLTGLYVANAGLDNYADNAECYINGGRFGTVCGAAMEGIGKANGADNTGDISWLIQNADIREFYAGGLNAAKPVTGNLSTTIVDSHVDIFCGGPKFGDMSANKTVVTNATGCTFGTFFGAGYGGNSYSRYAPSNQKNVTNINWNNWVRGQYDQSYSSNNGGVSTQIDYQFIPMSDNKTNVARLFVEYVKFSLATTRNVTSTLTNCTITGNFYGGGSLGKVEGNVTSILDSCTVQGSVFGAGYSASRPDVTVDAIGFEIEPYYYEELGTYRTGVKYKENSNYQPTIYTWEHDDAISIDKTKHILYTTEDLSKSNLGSVEGNAILTLQGTTRVEGSVYGGGDQSVVKGANKGNTTVILKGKANVIGNVYGGGNKGQVSGNSEVKIQD